MADHPPGRGSTLTRRPHPALAAGLAALSLGALAPIALGATRVVTRSTATTIATPRATVTTAVAAASGRLEAQGAGAISMEGSLVVFGVVRGKGASMLVQDLAGDIKVTLNGKARRLGRTGTLRLPDASGRFYVSGSRVRVRIAGPRVEASAAGTGRFLLEGRGSFSLNGAVHAPWPSAPAPQDLLPPARSSARR